MHKIILLATAAALAGCSQDQAGAPAEDANVAVEASPVADGNASGEALATLNETSWEFTDPKTGKPMQESIDAKGNYIVVSGTEHIDHGTAVMKDGKACFTSAMTKEGEECWTDPMLAVGASGESTSDKGEKVTVKRVVYTPLAM